MVKDLLKDGFVIISEKTPLLKFLLWNGPDHLEKISEEEAKSLYFRYEDYADLVKPTDEESRLIQGMLYGV